MRDSDIISIIRRQREKAQHALLRYLDESGPSDQSKYALLFQRSQIWKQVCELLKKLPNESSDIQLTNVNQEEKVI